MFDIRKAESKMRAIESELLLHTDTYPTDDPTAWRGRFDDLNNDLTRLRAAREIHLRKTMPRPA